MTNDAPLHFEQHLTVTSTDTDAIALLSAACGLSRTQLKQAMAKGALWLTRGARTQRIRRAQKTLQADDQLHLYYDQRILSTRPLAATLISDHGNYSIWHKPYGMFSQGSKWGDHCTIARWVTLHSQRPAFIVHRLDRATTGLIIIAHGKQSAAALAQLFAQRRIEKRYLAIVHGHPPASSRIDTAIEGKSAISHIRCQQVNTTRHQALVEIHIETGRKHQIRRHLSAAGFPVVGDRLYGQRDNNAEDKNLQLCCYSLGFICPYSQQAVNIRLDESLWPRLE